MNLFPRRLIGTAAIVMLAASFVFAFGQKEAQSDLDLLAFISPELRVVEFSTDADQLRATLPNIAAVDSFRAEHGVDWRVTIDEKRGVATLISGGSMAFIPGHANDLSWEEATPGCRENACIPRAHVETLARDFVDRYGEILGVVSSNLVLDVEGTKAVGASVYLLRFDYQVGGVPVDRASLFFRINGGNLIQVASQNIAPVNLSTAPGIDRETGWQVVQDYLGPLASTNDRVFDEGSLHLIPVTPRGIDADDFSGPVGSGLTFKLGWRYSFVRPDVIGTWEAVIDAHTGELLRFVDANRYGRIHGGAYPGDNHTGEADRPFPYADTGLPSPNQYADSGGLFPGDNATTTLNGKYARIDDSCGSISNTTTSGDVDFSLGAGTDCDTPPGNTGGAGNTHAARTQYYHLTAANLRAQGYLPDLTWLSNSSINVNVNQSPWCNATGGGDTLNFYRADTGCWNLGEIPGVSIHEWGHSLDSFDGSGGSSTPVETYADWMAALHLHDSCVGRGFYLSGNCDRYGDPCLDCSGIRDMDYTKHVSNTPWTAANYGSVWSGCNSGSYFGPCNLEDHCEAGVSSQALWDFVHRKLTAPPHNMDLRSAWLLADRLWYGGISTLGYDMYSCSVPNSDGCAGSHLFQVMLTQDDDDGNLANGTPHAAAIYSAMADHNIACGNPGDPGNQNSGTCPTIGTPVLTGTGLNNSASLDWPGVPGASRYWVYRNDIGCDAGFQKIAEVTGGATSYTDTTVVNGINYYYLVQGVPAADSCAGLVSNCETVVPVPCETPLSPTGLQANGIGDNRIDLSWASGAPPTATYNVYRSVGSCPQAEYELVAGGIALTSWVDFPISGQVNYSYVVTGVDTTGGCESSYSGCADASTTGTCTQVPSFDGLQTVTNPAAGFCALDLDWNPAVIHCSGPAAYDIYRSTDANFVPGPGNLIAAGHSATDFTDIGDLVSGTAYTYVVRATDTGIGAGETNTVRVTGTPTGPIVVGSWTDNAGDSGEAKLVVESPWTATVGQGVTGAGYQTGHYTNNLCAAATTPVMSLSTNPQLSFWSKYDIEAGWDKGLVQISTDGGANWERVAVNYPATVTRTNDECDLGTGGFFNGTSGTWNEFTASLATWAGQDVMLRWIFSSDGGVTGSGWWIDDIAITDVQVAGTCDTPPFFADDFESGNTDLWNITMP